MSADRYNDESPLMKPMDPMDPDGGDTVIDEEPPEELLRLVQEALANAPPDPDMFQPISEPPIPQVHVPGDSLPPIPDGEVAVEVDFSDEATVAAVDTTKKDNPIFDDEPVLEPRKSFSPGGAKFGGSPAQVSFDESTEALPSFEEATESALDDWGVSVDLGEFEESTELGADEGEKQSTLDLVVMNDAGMSDESESETDRSRLISSPDQAAFEGTAIGPLGPVELTQSQFLLLDNAPVREPTEPSGAVRIISEQPDPDSMHGEPPTDEEPVPRVANEPADQSQSLPGGWPFDDIALAQTRTQAQLPEAVPQPKKSKDPFRLSSVGSAILVKRSFFSGRRGLALLSGIAVLIFAVIIALVDQIKDVPEELDATAAVATTVPDPVEVPDPAPAEAKPESPAKADEKHLAKAEAPEKEAPKEAKAPDKPAPPPEPHPAPEPQNVNIKFDVAPKKAVVRVDGKVQRGPLVVPQSEKRYDVEVSAPGYQTMKHTITAEASRLVELKLEKAAVEIKPVAKKVRTKRKSRKARRVRKRKARVKKAPKKSTEVLVRGDDL